MHHEEHTGGRPAGSEVSHNGTLLHTACKQTKSVPHKKTRQQNILTLGLGCNLYCVQYEQVNGY